MNFPIFIVKKIALNPDQSFSRFILKISTAAVALSMSVMIIATALISGFQQTISQKVFGFWAHVIISPYQSINSLDKFPISKTNSLYTDIANYEEVEHIQSIALKGGILHTKEDFDGIILKGIGEDFKKDAMNAFLVEGEIFDLEESTDNPGILISKITANRLELELGDKVIISFIDESAQIRKRSFFVSGIYDSGVEEFDKQYAWIGIGVIRGLNDWTEDEVGGFEIFVKEKYLFQDKLLVYAKKIWSNFVSPSRAKELQKDELDKIGDKLFYSIDKELYAQTIKEFKPDIFNWLSLQNTNEIVILSIMLLVAAVNMITSLLILILERTRMIGILKALGTQKNQLRRIFVWNGVVIVGIGLLIGNVVGIALCLFQDASHLIKLPQDSYYIDYAPIHLEWTWIVFLNLFTLITASIFLLLPALLVNKIEAIKAIRFN